MSRPRLLVNNLIEDNRLVNNSDTKVYMILLAMCGIDRFSLISINIFAKYIIRILNIIRYLFIIYNTYIFLSVEFSVINLMLIFAITQHMLSVILAISRASNLKYFFASIYRFDEIYSCKLKFQPKLEVFKTITFLFFISLCSILSYLLPASYNGDFSLSHVLIIEIGYEFELLFYAHLLKITNNRINIIKYSLKRLLDINYVGLESDTERYNTQEKSVAYVNEISQLQSSYEFLADSTCRLHEALKWQITTGTAIYFIPTLFNWYLVVMGILNGEEELWLVTAVSGAIYSANIIFCQSVPCMMCSRLVTHVEEMKTYLITKLCQTNLGKYQKVATREFLYLLHDRDMKFTLLGMVDLNMMLPVNMLKLLITYLIILLQFKKIIDPTLQEFLES